jgi:hypothetical protein
LRSSAWLDSITMVPRMSADDVLSWRNNSSDALDGVRPGRSESSLRSVFSRADRIFGNRDLVIRQPIVI